MGEEFYNTIDHIHQKDPRYREDAYAFMMEALAYTQKKFRCPKHVTGEEMLMGLKELLLQKFGPMTLTVLKYWGINSTEDFGNIVFNLVDHNVLTKTEDDDINTFRKGYDFEEVFDRGYRKMLARKISRMRTG